MTEHGIFIGWGVIRAGREAATDRVFEEAVGYWNALKEAGEIESVEQVILGYHGGDLGGFALLRGDPEKLHRVWMSPEFQRMLRRGSVVLEGLGVVHAVIGAGVAPAMSEW